MCDHCNCREYAPIAELSREHVEILALASELAAATRAGAMRDPVIERRLRRILQVHSAKEEVGLYPLLIQEMGEPADAFDHLEAEHRDVLAWIEAGTFDHLALYALQRHIEEEEEVLFSGALFHFDGSTWDDLDAAHASVRKDAMLDVGEGLADHHALVTVCHRCGDTLSPQTETSAGGSP